MRLYIEGQQHRQVGPGELLSPQVQCPTCRRQTILVHRQWVELTPTEEAERQARRREASRRKRHDNKDGKETKRKNRQRANRKKNKQGEGDGTEPAAGPSRMYM